MAFKDLKIFSLHRLQLSELYEDAMTHLRKAYGDSIDKLTVASPLVQLLSVVLNLCKLVLYYIEDSISGLSIHSSFRPDQIRSLMALTSHEASFPVSARGAVRIYYRNNGQQYSKNQITCYIPNKITCQSLLNGCKYTLLFGSDSAQITIGPNTAGNYIDAHLVEGTIKYQSATSTGYPYASYNFSERSFQEIDEHYINVYVNSERWQIVKSFMDMTYNQKACVIKKNVVGATIAVIFGNGDYGAIPPKNSTVLVEYIISSGIVGNLSKTQVNQMEKGWKIYGNGFLSDGTQISLDDNFYLAMTTDLIFGAPSEDITLTQMIAPHASRSFVLANETNYRYFFARMNMFSTIEVVTGYASKERNIQAQINYEKVYNDYQNALSTWHDLVAQYGDSSTEAKEQYNIVQSKLTAVSSARQTVEDTDMKDNTVYILLIPDISKRMTSSMNYFTVPEDMFLLSPEEQYNIIQMIEDSGQKIITMETRLLEPKTPRFAINANVKIWEGYSLESVYANALSKLSDYLIGMTRKDMVPLSDITALFEGVEGVDSVKVWFDADVDNEAIYGKQGFYGIDEFGDIILTRTYTSGTGSVREVRDILPLFRGGFVSPSGIEYSDVQSNDYTSAFNLILTSYTHNSKLSLENPIN